ncbi:MAG: peptidoglycan bridge formation glycyltransferase FemA/FemB family protein [Oscillospiraceae bacterium]
MATVDFSNPVQCVEYEAFVAAHANGCFMQSLKWARVKPDWGHEAVLVRNAAGVPVAAALILIKKVPLLKTCLFYLPHGPVWDYGDAAAFNAVIAEVRKLARSYHAYRCILDPFITEGDTAVIDAVRAAGFSFKADAAELTTVQPRNNYMLFLRGRSEEQVFAAFHGKWRYNIRVALRHSVECRVCGKEALDDFCRLMEETGQRDGFAVRSKAYFARMLDELGAHCRLFMCYHGDEALSGAITTQYAGKTCYVYGASSNEHRDKMPNYLMQWTMIRWAIESGGEVYDFQGIPFYTDENHANYGVYRFKKGFSGEVVTYAGEFTENYKPAIAAVLNALLYLRWLKADLHRRRLIRKSAPKNQRVRREASNPSALQEQCT